MKRKVVATFITLSLALTLSGLSGCGSDKTAAESESVSESKTVSESVSGKGVAGERYTADFNGHTYEFIDEDTTWEEARNACIRHGGHLATVTSAMEQEYLEKMFININGNERGPWFGSYSEGAYGGDKNDWSWVTGEKWNYTNWAEGEPSNAEGTEWFTHFWTDMKWNDISNEDTRSSQKGYICEYDDLSGILDDGGKLIMSDPPETDDYDFEEDDDWIYTLQEEVEEDPCYKDLEDGRYAIQSHWRGVQIKYPGSYFADADGNALYVYDGDAMYVYATNITKAAEDDDRNLEAFCLERAEEQALSYFTELYGAPTNMDGTKREGGDGKNRICLFKANLWNNNADVGVKSKVVISGKQNDYLILCTIFWRYGDDVSRKHADKVKVTSWGKGDMYG